MEAIRQEAVQPPAAQPPAPKPQAAKPSAEAVGTPAAAAGPLLSESPAKEPHGPAAQPPPRAKDIVFPPRARRDVERQNYFEGSSAESDSESSTEGEHAHDIRDGRPVKAPRKFPDWAMRDIEVFVKDEGKRGEDISRWVPAKPLKYKDGAWIEVEYHWFLDRQDWHDRFYPDQIRQPGRAETLAERHVWAGSALDAETRRLGREPRLQQAGAAQRADGEAAAGAAAEDE